MDKYVIAPPSGSTNNSVGAEDRPWNEGHFDSVKLNGGDLGEYLAESTGYGIVSGCEPTISGLTVTVGAGIVHLADGTRKELSATNITLDNADPTNPRIDLVYIDSTGTVARVTGTAAASPVVPTLPTGGISVAQVSVAAGASTGTVTDSRGMLATFSKTKVVVITDYGDDARNDIGSVINSIIKTSNDGVSIYIPQGSYSLITPIVINKNTVTICGENINTEITVDAVISKAIIVQDNQVNYLKLSNLSIVCQNKADYGLYSDGVWVAYSHFSNIHIKNAVECNILCSCFMTKFEKCVLSNSKVGLLIPPVGEVRGTSTTLDNVYAKNCSVAGLQLKLVYSTLINCASDRNEIGYYIENCKGVSMLDCGAEYTKYPIKVGTLWGGGINGFYGWYCGDDAFTSSDNLIEMYSPVNVTISGIRWENTKGTPKVLALTGSNQGFENITVLDNSVSLSDATYVENYAFKRPIKFLRGEYFVSRGKEYYDKSSRSFNTQTDRQAAIKEVMDSIDLDVKDYMFSIRYASGYYEHYVASCNSGKTFTILGFAVNNETTNLRIYVYNANTSPSTCNQKTLTLN